MNAWLRGADSQLRPERSRRREEAETLEASGSSASLPRRLPRFTTFLGCLLLATAVTASAHRLDEYLQATRVAVATNRIDVSIDLTPGVAVVSNVLAEIDTNHDAQLSKSERQAYVGRLLNDLRAELNGQHLKLTLVESTFPTIPEMKDGLGIIRVKASAAIGALPPGTHTFTLTNGHLPTISVYLVNALVPKDRVIQIKKQTRDELQKSYQLQFAVNPAARSRLNDLPTRRLTAD